MNEKVVGYVEAVVRLPIYESDGYVDDKYWNWFMYHQPSGMKRDCDLISATFYRQEVPNDHQE